jgi:hypothetical protein
VSSIVASSSFPRVVEFSGPFAWTGYNAPSIFDAPIGAEGGVYLWTVQLSDGELIYYVGETGRRFATRMHEHLKEHLSGGYHLYRPYEFSTGTKVLVWNGLYGPDRESVQEVMKRYFDLVPVIEALTGIYRFYLAPLPGERRVRERIEGAIAYALYGHDEDRIKLFQEAGIRYRPRWPSEAPETITFRSSERLLGVPDGMQV